MRENPELTKSEESTGNMLPLYKGTSVRQGTVHRPHECKGEISKINYKRKVLANKEINEHGLRQNKDKDHQNDRG